jgi:predicted acetyltransferase
MRDQGQSIAILWASMGAIYQRFGYGLAASMVRYEFDPRLAALEPGEAHSGTAQFVPAATARPALEAIYGRFITGRNLPIHRTGFLWEGELREKPGSPRYVAIYTAASGDQTGYMVYRTRDGHGITASQEMTVSDFIHCDVDAFRGLWDYFLRHDLVSKVTMSGVVAEDDPAFDLLSEPRVLQRRTIDAIWLRIVDVADALPRRPYGAAGSLVFAIPTDDQCPWNAGAWQLETDGESATVSRTAAEPTLAMPINTLAGLLTGFRSATHYQRIGRLECTDPRSLALADAMFRTDSRPFTPNDF